MNAPDDEPNLVDALVREEVRRLDPYQVSASDGLVKLDAMENPYPLPTELKTQWLEALREVEVNRYPDSQCQILKHLLRTTFELPAEGLVLGNGSDELIQMIALLVGGAGRTLLAPTPTFSMYPLIAATTASAFVGVPLGEDFSLDREGMLAAIRRHRPACVFLAYPNNPTGNRFAEIDIGEVLESAPGLVVLDEAYFPFCQRSFLHRLGDFPNLLVLRTLSKNGMAGLRLGLLVGDASWTTQLEKMRLPYNINSLTQRSAQFYLTHYGVIQQQAARIICQRESLYAQLANLHWLRAYPSEANFILFRVETGSAQRVHTHLQQQGILIKNLHQSGTPLENCLRVTVGSEEQNQEFIGALAAFSP